MFNFSLYNLKIINTNNNTNNRNNTNNINNTNNTNNSNNTNNINNTNKNLYYNYLAYLRGKSNYDRIVNYNKNIKNPYNYLYKTHKNIIVTVTVTYDGNRSTEGSVPVDTSYNYNSYVITLDNTGSLVKAGYKFSSWNTSRDGSGTRYFPGDGFTIISNTILYAIYVITNYEALTDSITNVNGLSNNCLSIVINNDNSKLYAAGNYSTAGNNSKNNIALWDLNKQLWSSLGSGLTGGMSTNACYCLHISPDGTKVYAGGEFTIADNNPVNYVAVWNTTTSTWSALGSGLNGACNAICVSADGTKVYVGGSFTSPGGRIAVWNTITSKWSSLGSGLNYNCNAITISPDGTTLYAGGKFTSPGKYIAKWNISTSTWSELGSGLNKFCNSISISSDGTTLYAGGNFTSPGNCIAKWNIDTNMWSALGKGLNEGFCSSVYVNSDNTEVYAGGNFTVAGGKPINYFAVWNITSSRWYTLEIEPNGNLNSVVINSTGTKLYIGGVFNTAGNITTNKIAAYNL